MIGEQAIADTPMIYAAVYVLWSSSLQLPGNCIWVTVSATATPAAREGMPWVQCRLHLQVGAGADDGVLQVTVVLNEHAVHEHAVDDLDTSAQLAHGPQHAALDGAFVPHCGATAHHTHRVTCR